MRGLVKSRPALIGVILVTSSGSCATQPTVLLCVVPSAPPSNIQAAMVDNTTMYLTWEPPPPQHLNGPLLGYKVKQATPTALLLAVYSTG